MVTGVEKPYVVGTHAAGVVLGAGIVHTLGIMDREI